MKATIETASSVAAPVAPAKRESRACPVCNRSDCSPLFECDGWPLVQCGGCGLAYMPEVPTDEAIDTDFEWSESFARERYERWMRNPFARAYTMAVLFLKPSREGRAMRLVKRYVSGGKLIDVGCGDGRMLMHARRAGFDAIGVEPSAKMAARAARRVGPENVKVGRLQDFDFAPSSVDAIITVSYVEHEPRPAAAMRDFFKLLRPGGYCIQKTPNYDSKLRTLLGKRWSGYRFPEHVQYFNGSTFGRLMREAGFEIAGVHANPFGDNFWVAARKPKN